MKRFVLMFCMVVLGVFILFSCSNKRNTLIVGLECDYAPFNWTETTKTETNVPISNLSGGYADGYDVQIAKLLASALNLELVIRQVSWDGLIPALNNSEIDVIIAGMSPTAERSEIIDFTSAYYTSNHVVVLRENSIYASATTLNDLSGSKGVGQKDTIYADLVAQLGSDNNVTVLPVIDTVPQIVNMILNNEADFTIVEYPVALGIIQANPSLTAIFTDPSINYFNVSSIDRDVSIGVRKNRSDLLSNLNNALANISLEERIEIMQAAIERS